MVFRKKIPRGRKNYVGFFDASCVGNRCQNSNLMNSKIVTFYTILHVTIHVLQKNYDFVYIQTNIEPKQWVIYF